MTVYMLKIKEGRDRKGCFLKLKVFYCWSFSCSSQLRESAALVVLFVGLLLCVVYRLLFVVVLSCALVCGDWLWRILSDWFTFWAVWCFVCVVLLGALGMLHFHVSVYCLMLTPRNFMCVQCVGVMLEWIDSWECVIFLLHVGHMYFVCGPGFLYVPRQCE